MSIIDWNQGLVTGFYEIDQQHEHLVGLINNAHDTYVEGASKESLEPLLDELVDYATYHFAAEERYMQNQSYPDRENHNHEHDKFSARVIAFQQDFAAGRAHLSLEVLLFMKNWLTNHIMHTDMAMGAYLNRT